MYSKHVNNYVDYAKVSDLAGEMRSFIALFMLWSIFGWPF